MAGAAFRRLTTTGALAALLATGLYAAPGDVTVAEAAAPATWQPCARC